MVDKNQSWLRVPIRIGRPGYSSDPTVDPYANPLVNTDLTVGPYQPGSLDESFGGISSLYGKAGEMIRRLTAGKAPTVREDRETRERPAFKLGPVPGSDTPVLPSLAVVDPTTILEDRVTRERPAFQLGPIPGTPDPAAVAQVPGLTLPNLYTTDPNAPTFKSPLPEVSDIIKKKIEDSPKFEGPVKTLVKRAIDAVTPEVTYKDGIPYTKDSKGNLVPYKGVLTEGGLPDIPSLPSYGPNQPAQKDVPVPSPLADVLEDRATRERRADPSAPVNPANPEQPPAPAKEEASPVLTQLPAGTATGALSIDDYLETIKKAYPDLDFQKNPAQDLADANARRDLDRTALLAQLSFASGIVSGAGKSWEGIGQGFASAAGTYDKGFEKYQNALQSSADRYQRQQEQAMTYDTARRQAALGLYTSATTNAAENERLNIKMANDRIWDEHKLTVESERQTAKQDQDNINKYFDRYLKPFEPASDSSTADPAEEARKAQKYEEGMKLRERSLAVGHIIPTYYNVASQ